MTRSGTLPSPDVLSRANFELIVRRIADDIAFGTDDSLFVGSGLEYAQSRPYEPIAFGALLFRCYCPHCVRGV